MVGELFIVSTPIGNLNDITLRAIQTIKDVDFILAEDTRVARKLLNHLGIKANLQSLNEHNELKKIPIVLSHLLKGKNIALISDAGTPLISDPGFQLVKRAKKESLRVIPIPGCSASIAALTASGVPTNRFYFYGFLPKTKNKRLDTLKTLVTKEESIILYESVHRLSSSIEDMIKVFGKSHIAVLCKEITKLHEEFIGNNLEEIRLFLMDNPSKIKGEFTLILNGKESSEEPNTEKIDSILKELLPIVSVKVAVKICSISTGFNKNKIYKRAIELKP
ncbi:MAG: 16S rRNA (cytidine(1402)-2'-O)-methyltransferase [Gammaproteobacteria bacterium]|nr:16S rRNA (cytidine(1402)-2'-O)-methyltransferase [Gammaproteobacteria bacterium]